MSRSLLRTVLAVSLTALGAAGYAAIDRIWFDSDSCRLIAQTIRQQQQHELQRETDIDQVLNAIPK